MNEEEMNEEEMRWGKILYHFPDGDGDFKIPVGFFTSPETYDKWRIEVIGSYEEVPLLPPEWELSKDVAIDEGPLSHMSSEFLVPDNGDTADAVIDYLNWREENQ